LSVSKLYIDHAIADDPQTKVICQRINVPYETIDNADALFKSVSSSDDPVQQGKQVLYLTRNKGNFLKKCPGTRQYTCCDYQILHIGTFCTMDCSYCILQAYFHPPMLQYFVNHDDMLNELDKLFAEKKLYRVGTGEFTDSLIWEQWTDLSPLLVSRFAQQSSSVLELKTKTVAVDKLKGLDHNRKTIMAWSLNTEKIIKSDERHTTSLSARLKAAAKCESWGYPLAFHFDPMVIYEGCEADYRKVVEQIFAHVSAENIAWISLGTFRFIPTLKQIIQQRFADSRIVYGEFITGLDGKMRYFKPLRIALFQKMVSYIREIAPQVTVYFCMEDDEVWEKALGFLPSERGGLPNMLDESARKHCSVS
jgi:spore photoproduct lyase